jgi:hypothetical protein
MIIQNIGNTHLTPTDIKHIKALFKSGHTQAKINRATWIIISGNAEKEYKLTKIVKDRGIGFIGEPLRENIYNFNVKIKNN